MRYQIDYTHGHKDRTSMLKAVCILHEHPGIRPLEFCDLMWPDLKHTKGRGRIASGYLRRLKNIGIVLIRYHPIFRGRNLARAKVLTYFLAHRGYELLYMTLGCERNEVQA